MSRYVQKKKTSSIFDCFGEVGNKFVLTLGKKNLLTIFARRLGAKGLGETERKCKQMCKADQYSPLSSAKLASGDLETALRGSSPPTS